MTYLKSLLTATVCALLLMGAAGATPKAAPKAPAASKARFNFDRSTGLPAPKGLLRLLSLKNFNTEDQLQRLRKELKENPYLNGAVIGADWSALEPEQGKFDFASLDALIKLVDEMGLDYKLGVKPGNACPQYIYDGITRKINTTVSNHYRPDYGVKTVVPIPWDPFYRENLKRMFTTVFGRYRADKHFIVANLTGANNMSAEWHLPKEPSDVAQWEADSPDYKDKIRDFWIDMIDFFATLLPDRRMSLSASSNPVNGMNDQANQIVEYGIAKYPGQFMIQINQLHGNSDQITFEAFARLMNNKDRIVVGIQSLASIKASLEGSSDRQGSLEMSVFNFLQSGANYWELWDGDAADPAVCKKVYDQIVFASGLGLEGYKAWLISKGKYIDAKPEPSYKDRMKAAGR